MKTKLYHILLNSTYAAFYVAHTMRTSDYLAEDKKDRYSVERAHRILRQLWFRESNATRFMYKYGAETFREEFEYKYRKHSRKYWTPEARILRVLNNEQD